MSKILLTFLLMYFQTTLGGHIEKVVVSGCASCRIYLTCGGLTTIIAIKEATFVPDNITVDVTTPFPQPYPRHCLNSRCSGVNHCSFILVEDCPRLRNWEEGTLFVEYICIPDDRINKYCNQDIILPDKNHDGISEGFISNPGYPRFYGGQSPCRWRISVPDQQRIRITVLDISIIVDNPTNPDDCTEDQLEIFDSDILVYSTCHQREPPDEILSISETLEIVFYSSERLTPSRGFLLHYTAVGCPTPIPPADSYLVYINDSFALFSCCVGYVFPDIGTRSKELKCEGSKWNEAMPLPNCEQLDYSGTESFPELTQIMTADIMAPAFIIAALFVINSVVLFYIYKAKRRNIMKLKDEEIGALNSQEMSAVVT